MTHQFQIDEVKANPPKITVMYFGGRYEVTPQPLDDKHALIVIPYEGGVRCRLSWTNVIHAADGVIFGMVDREIDKTRRPGR